MEKQRTVELTATEYEPKRNFRFVMHLEGLDAFIVKGVITPELEFNGENFSPRGDFLVDIYSPKGTEENLAKILGQTKEHAYLDFIDGSGLVMDSMVLNDVLIVPILPSQYFSYSSNEPITWRITLRPDTVTIKTSKGS